MGGFVAFGGRVPAWSEEPPMLRRDSSGTRSSGSPSGKSSVLLTAGDATLAGLAGATSPSAGVLAASALAGTAGRSTCRSSDVDPFGESSPPADSALAVPELLGRACCSACGLRKGSCSSGSWTLMDRKDPERRRSLSRRSFSKRPRAAVSRRS